jgi:hypothetical protein
MHTLVPSMPGGEAIDGLYCTICETHADYHQRGRRSQPVGDVYLRLDLVSAIYGSRQWRFQHDLKFGRSKELPF